MIQVIAEWYSVFPYFFQFKPEFCNEFMIWATFSSQSCFFWLYRTSPSLAAKNIINLVFILTTWWCSCVESSLMLLEEGVCYDQCVLLQNSVSLCLTSLCTLRPTLPVTPCISWLPTFAFQSPMMKRTSLMNMNDCPHLCFFKSGRGEQFEVWKVDFMIIP